MTRVDLTVSAMSQTVCPSQALDMPQDKGKKTTKKQGGPSRHTTDHDDDDEKK